MEIRDILDQNRATFEGLCAARAKYAYLGEGEGLCRVLGKYLMYVNTRDTAVAPHLIQDGFWESWITQALSRLPEGITCVDVGANHGYYTLLLADLCKGHVIAFEPQAKMAEIIRKSVQVCGANLVNIWDCAVGDKPGMVSLHTHHPCDRGSVYCRYNDESGGSLVRVVTLDDAIPHFDFIKIDAEGFEPKIWAGMRRHLERRPTILMEFSPHSYEDAGGFLDEIEACYTLREVDTSGSVVPVDRETVLERSDFSMLWLEAENES